MVNSKALSVILTQDLFDNYFDMDFTCEEYIAAATDNTEEYGGMREQVEQSLFNLTDEQYDEILKTQSSTQEVGI